MYEKLTIQRTSMKRSEEIKYEKLAAIVQFMVLGLWHSGNFEDRGSPKLQDSRDS